MTWLLLAFISVLFRSIYGVMTKVLSNRLSISAYSQATILSLSGALIALMLSPFLGGLDLDVSDASWITIVLLVLGQGLGNVTYFAAIKHLTNGTAQIAFSSILIFNTLLALTFLGLQLTPLNIIGILLLMLAIVSVVSGRIELNRTGVALMLLSAFFFSVFQLASADISKDVSPATYLLIAYIGAAVVVFTLKAKVVMKDLKAGNMKTTFGIPLLTAVPSLGNFLFAYYAYREAPEPARVAMLLTSQVVFTVIISYFVLNEKGHILRKMAAAGLVVLAAFLIKG